MGTFPDSDRSLPPPSRRLGVGVEDWYYKSRMFVLFFLAEHIKYSAKEGIALHDPFLFLMYQLAGAINTATPALAVLWGFREERL